MRFPIDQIWIDDDAIDQPLTTEVLRQAGNSKVLVGPEADLESRKLELEPDPFRRGKRILRLVRYKGAFVKPCPGTAEYLCCGLQILHVGQGCPMDCRYCALQIYFNRPVLELFVNTDDLVKELECRLKEPKPGFRRYCTGEFTDSLALEPMTGLAARLVEIFASQSEATLELKTKTDFIDPLLELDPRGSVIISFSVNSDKVFRNEEIRAVPVERRLAAAAKAQRHGYRLGFHFDPIIPLPGWEGDYSRVIDLIFRVVDPSAIAWISLGVLRFVPSLKETATARFGPIPHFHDAFRPGLDGKSRLDVDRRIEVYRFMAQRIRRHSPDARIYLCMESPEVWKKSLGIAIASNEELSAYLDEAVTRGRTHTDDA